MSRQSIQAGKAVIVIDLADQASAKFAGLVKGMSAKMMQASRSLRDTALNSTAGFIVTKMAVGSLTKDFVSFEDKILNLTAKMGFFGNKTAAQTAVIANLRQHIMYLGRTTAYTSQEVADAAISLAQAGFSADEIKASLKGTLDFARGTSYELGEAADMVANLVRTFDMFGANDTLEQRTAKITSLTSQLVKTTRLGTVEIQDLRESLKYAGGSANNLGIELPVLLGFLTQMSESGLKASLAGTSLNTALLNMIKSSDKLKKVAPDFQIVTDAQGNENLVATMYKLFQISNKMSKVERAAFFQDIFNIRGARATSAVQEMDRVDKFIKQIQNAGAESTLAASLMESGAGGAIRRFTSAIETLRITLFETYSKEFTAFTNGLAYLVTVVEEASQKYKGLILTLLLSPVIFGAMAIGSMTLSYALARLAVALKLVSVAGRGLKFLGGSLLSAAKGTAMLFGPKGPSRSAQIAAQTKAVAKLQAKVNAMTATAQKKKTASGQAKALASVQSSKSMQKLVAATQKLQALQSRGGGVFGKLVQGAKQIVPLTQKMAGVVSRSARAFVARQKAIKTNALMNSAIRGEQMIALKQERAMQTQIAKAATPIKTRTSKVARLPDLAKERQKYAQLLAKGPKSVNMGAIMKPMAQSLKTLLSPENLRYVDQLYDRLYKVRQIIGTLPENIKTPQGLQPSQTYLKYRAEEAVLAKKINFFESRRAQIQTQMKNTVAQVRRYEAAPVLRQAERVKRVAALHTTARRMDAANVAKATADRTKQAATLKRLEIAQRGQRVASEMKIATLRSRLTNVRSMGSMVGGGMMKGLTALKSGGIALFKNIFNLGTLGKVITSINSIAFGFLKVAGAVARFAFSWNFVGMVFNILLLFGDKIPPVVDAFRALGRGIGGAFAEIGRIFTYAAPAMKLFQLAFNAFLQGDTQTGVSALRLGFAGIVDIVGNQLVAAWNTFMQHVGYLWDMLMKIFVSLKSIFSSIFEGVSQTLGVVTGPIIKSFNDIFSMFGGGKGLNMNAMGYGFVVGLDHFITNLFKGAIFMHEQLMKFLAAFQKVLGVVISRLPGMGAAGEGIQKDAEVTSQTAFIESKRARKALEAQRLARQQELAAVFNTDSRAKSNQRGLAADNANWASGQTSIRMTEGFDRLREMFEANMRQRAAEMDRLQRGGQQPNNGPGTIRGERDAQRQRMQDELNQRNAGGLTTSQLTQELPKYLQALTGGAMSTRAIYKVDTKKQEEIMQRQLEAQQETNRILSLGGGIQ